jgi:hypothetical protein
MEIHIKTILSGTSSSIRTKLWWNSHWMVLFQNCVRQSRSPTKMATTVQLRCYWKQLWSRWAITGSCEPLVVIYKAGREPTPYWWQKVYVQCIWFNENKDIYKDAVSRLCLGKIKICWFKLCEIISVLYNI